MEIRTVMSTTGSADIAVRHARRTELTGAERSDLFVEAPDDNEILTEVVVGGASESVAVRVHWMAFGGLDAFHVLHVAEQHVLFVGSGRVSATIALDRRLILELEYPTLFWNFERFDEHVVAFGELECLLYRLDGLCVERAAVDPPYDVKRSPEGLRFESIVAGTTFLRF